VILVCGEALFDLFVEDRTAGGFSFDARLGGSAFNVAVAHARLGRPVSLLTGVSRDFLGERIMEALLAEGVGTTFCKRTAAPTTLALVSTAGDGVPAYAFHGEGAADRRVEQGDLPDPGGFGALVFGCFSLLTQPTGDSFLALARAASGRVPVVLDPNVRLSVEPDVALWRARVEAFAAEADVVKASEEDLEALGYGTPDEAARHFLSHGAELFVVTRGAAGASVFLPAQSLTASAPAVDVMDTVGAGDVFLAALLAGLHEEGRLAVDGLAALSPEEAARAAALATTAAALTCARRGADPPSLSAVRDRVGSD